MKGTIGGESLSTAQPGASIAPGKHNFIQELTMDIAELFKPGMTNEAAFEVKEEHSALQLGSGSLRVLATPMMIRFMELLSHKLLAENLPAGYSSVGVHVDVRHLAPTPINKSVRVRCEILEVKGRRIKFSVTAWDEIEKIGEGQHKRVIIEVDRFFSRVEAKMN